MDSRLLGLFLPTNYDYRVWRGSSPCLTFQGAKPTLKRARLLELGVRLGTSYRSVNVKYVSIILILIISSPLAGFEPTTFGLE